MHSNNIINFFYGFVTKYPTPSNLTYFWNFGVFSFFALIIQIITGILLVMHYTPHIDLAFSSVEHIMRDIDFGWLLRYTHANGASLFFIVMYLHISRSLLYGSYISRGLLWSSGVIIFLLTIITAFLGYILPWGQMSLWGATVITNLASAIPVIGNTVVISLWGGFSVANPTLNRFFSLHYLMPFLILVLVLGHLFLLHLSGSNNPLGVNYKTDSIQFAPYYTIKDIFSLSPLLIIFGLLIYFIPNELGHPDNYIMANADVTPAHIVPEWYFLIFYGILRSISSKTFGILAMISAIAIFFLLSFKNTNKTRVASFKKIYYYITIIFISITILLGYIGSKSIEYPFYEISQFLTFSYFFMFFVYIFFDKFNFFSLKIGNIKKIINFFVSNVIFVTVAKKFPGIAGTIATFGIPLTIGYFNFTDKYGPIKPPDQPINPYPTVINRNSSLNPSNTTPTSSNKFENNLDYKIDFPGNQLELPVNPQL